jgi:dipeptide/tripeptide permease
MNTNPMQPQSETLFGHPAGLFTLFFAEMWERFSYYGMRALLVFYMIKGFMKYGDNDAYTIYGAYTALVYMTPFFGGMLADRLLGARRAVVLGGLLMAAGHLMMTVENTVGFFTALALLICGNGFFKPNISTIVGSLYPQDSARRDAGFTIFYMGINLGAAMSPLLCGYIGETYGWHYGFGLATIGMLTGVAIFVAPSLVSQVSMFAVAILAAVNIVLSPAGSSLSTYMNLVVLACLALAGFSALARLGRGRRLEEQLVPESPVSRFIARIVIMAGAIAAAVGLFVFRPDNPFSVGVNVFVGISLLLAAVVAWVALGRGGLPSEAGAPPDAQRLRRPVAGLISAEWVTYLGTAVAIAIFVLLVSGFAPLTRDKRPLTLVPDSVIKEMSAGKLMHTQLEALQKAAERKNPDTVGQLAEQLQELHENNDLGDEQYSALKEAVSLAKAEKWESAQQQVDQLKQRFPRERMQAILAVFLKETSRPAGLVLLLSGLVAFLYLGIETLRLDVIPRQRMYVVLILTFFSMLFWSFFEQAGSSVNNFTDRNVDRVFEQRHLTAQEVGKELGKTIGIQPTQEQLGYHNGGQLFTLDVLDKLRDEHKDDPNFEIAWTVADDNVGMGLADRVRDIPASTFQSVNPIYILIFGLVFTALWTVLAKLRLEPSTPVKFALGLLQLGLGFGAFWYGAQTADERGMVALAWLFLGYLLHTTGELCLSPVGLSMVSKLSPARLVSTVMGVWFLATAFSQLLAAIIAQFTGVTAEGGGAETAMPIPKETVHVYGDVFGTVAISAMVAALICFALSPLLSRWMHPEEDLRDEAQSEDDQP